MKAVAKVSERKFAEEYVSLQKDFRVLPGNFEWDDSYMIVHRQCKIPRKGNKSTARLRIRSDSIRAFEATRLNFRCATCRPSRRFAKFARKFGQREGASKVFLQLRFQREK
jgi:hypothetical protein